MANDVERIAKASQASSPRGFIEDTSQERAILDFLWDGEWKSSRDLSAKSLQYSARIFSLRKKGWVIENRLEVCDGKRRGFFRLKLDGSQADLFAARDLTPATWRDPEEAGQR
jgi:hypothetical protein